MSSQPDHPQRRYTDRGEQPSAINDVAGAIKRSLEQGNDFQPRKSDTAEFKAIVNGTKESVLNAIKEAEAKGNLILSREDLAKLPPEEQIARYIKAHKTIVATPEEIKKYLSNTTSMGENFLNEHQVPPRSAELIYFPDRNMCILYYKDDKNNFVEVEIPLPSDIPVLEGVEKNPDPINAIVDILNKCKRLNFRMQPYYKNAYKDEFKNSSGRMLFIGNESMGYRDYTSAGQIAEFIKSYKEQSRSQSGLLEI